MLQGTVNQSRHLILQSESPELLLNEPALPLPSEPQDNFQSKPVGIHLKSEGDDTLRSSNEILWMVIFKKCLNSE